MIVSHEAKKKQACSRCKYVATTAISFAFADVHSMLLLATYIESIYQQWSNNCQKQHQHNQAYEYSAKVYENTF